MASGTEPYSSDESSTDTPSQNELTYYEILETTLPLVALHTWKVRVYAVLTLVLTFISNLVGITPSLANKFAMDQLSEGKIPFIPLAAMVAANVISKLLGTLEDLAYDVVESSCDAQFSCAIFDHLQALSLDYHLKRGSSSIVGMVERYNSAITDIVDTILFSSVPMVMNIAAALAIFKYLETGYIGLVLLVSLPIFAAVNIKMTAWQNRQTAVCEDEEDMFSDRQLDTLSHFETVKMFCREHFETEEYSRSHLAVLERGAAFRNVLKFAQQTQQSIQILSTGMCMLLAATEVVHGHLTVGDFVLVHLCVGKAFAPIASIAKRYEEVSESFVKLRKCAKFLRTPISVQDRPGARSLDELRADAYGGRLGQVEFDNVSFQYESRKAKEGGGALRNISFTVQPGNMLAIVGTSGVGKTTVMRLLLRLFDVTEGAVRIDGHDVRDVTQKSLRNSIGVVAQDTVLFNDTIRKNIAYGKPGASEEEISDAVRTTALDELIESLPDGLDTLVGERGIRLSGGERQRVGCARCVVKQPTIVLLDEATSALDSLTEQRLQRNLAEVCRGLTTVVVAHRLSTIYTADEIIVLGKEGCETAVKRGEDSEGEKVAKGDEGDEGDEGSGGKGDGVGCIIERGTHAELLAQNSTYAEMWAEQTGTT